MSVNSTKSLADVAAQFGWEHRESHGIGLKDIIQQLQGLRISKVVGGAQSANLNLLAAGGGTGNAAHQILPTDVILGAIMFQTNAASFSLRNDVVCRSTGTVRFTGGATTNRVALLFWYDTSGWVSET